MGRPTDGFPEFPARGQTVPDGGDEADTEPDAGVGLRVLVAKPGATDWALSLTTGTRPETGTIDTELRELFVFSTPGTRSSRKWPGCRGCR